MTSPIAHLAIALLALAGSAAAEESLTIVSSLPRTGSANAQTGAMVNGIRLAIDQAGGAVAGFRINYLDWDDASPEKGNWDPKVEGANARRATEDPEVMVYIGTYNSGAAKISMPELNKAGIAMISPANTAAELTKPGMGKDSEPAIYRPTGKVTYFRVVPADDIQGLVGAQWARELGAKKVYVLHDREVYGQGVATVFKTSAEKMGLEVVGFEGINPREPNYRSLVTKMKLKKPDLVYFGGTTQSNGAQVLKDMVASGVNAKYMAPDGCCEAAFVQAAGEDAVNDRAYFTFPGVPTEQLSAKGKAFFSEYEAKFGIKAEPYAIYGYECGLVAIDAIRRAGKRDRAAIVDAMAATKDFDGALGKWSFDANGDTTIATFSGRMWKNGEFQFVKVLGE
jgi:branched-chain amino acid transport system substrate-binding protein